jgi:hypothetical protein
MTGRASTSRTNTWAAVGADAGAADVDSTSPTNRNPCPWTVLISLCALPSSSSACRTDLMRLDSTESETARPDQTVSMISSRGTIRCRFSTSIVSTEKTCGSTAMGRPSRRSS